MSLSGERRIQEHPILPEVARKQVTIYYDGQAISAYEGEPIAAALMSAGLRSFRRTVKKGEPRGIFCAIGRCTDCMMIVNGKPNIRTCVTPVEDGMRVSRQLGYGKAEEAK
ncbi:MAG: (2Fe-2S)-binding protein [Clostridiales bacterium]